MKRLAMFAVVLLVFANVSGCRRGLRLWGVRGAPCAPCAPAYGVAPAPAAVPSVQYSGCETCPPTNCYDAGAGYAGAGYAGCADGQTQLIYDGGYNIRPGETLGAAPADAPPMLPPTSSSTGMTDVTP